MRPKNWKSISETIGSVSFVHAKSYFSMYFKELLKMFINYNTLYYILFLSSRVLFETAPPLEKVNLDLEFNMDLP